MMRERMSRRALLVIVLLAATTQAAACARYRVRDLQTGSIYYARDINEETNIKGAARFTDAVTGAPVVLTHYESEKMSKKAFKRAIKRERAAGG